MQPRCTVGEEGEKHDALRSRNPGFRLFWQMGNVDSAAAGEDAGSLFGPFIIGLFAMLGSNNYPL
jgi:hypothetical protein